MNPHDIFYDEQRFNPSLRSPKRIRVSSEEEDALHDLAHDLMFHSAEEDELSTSHACGPRKRPADLMDKRDEGGSAALIKEFAARSTRIRTESSSSDGSGSSNPAGASLPPSHKIDPEDIEPSEVFDIKELFDALPHPKPHAAGRAGAATPVLWDPEADRYLSGDSSSEEEFTAALV